MEDRLLREKEAYTTIAVSKTKFWEMIKKGTIPKPTKIGGCSVWFMSDIQNYIKELKNNREKRKTEKVA